MYYSKCSHVHTQTHKHTQIKRNPLIITEMKNVCSVKSLVREGNSTLHTEKIFVIIYLSKALSQESRLSNLNIIKNKHNEIKNGQKNKHLDQKK